jgi:oligopeptidase B
MQWAHVESIMSVCLLWGGRARRVWATAGDGVKVPISLLLRRSNFRQDGSAALLLSAYGAYGAAKDPHFDGNILSIVDR